MNTISLNINGELPGAVATPTTPEQRSEQRELIQAIKALNGSEMLGQNNELTFSLDRGTHRAVVKIVNRETNEVVRQIPPEVVLRLAEQLLKTKPGEP
jgi:flagellar protein FlaG